MQTDASKEREFSIF